MKILKTWGSRFDSLATAMVIPVTTSERGLKYMHIPSMVSMKGRIKKVSTLSPLKFVTGTVSINRND